MEEQQNTSFRAWLVGVVIFGMVLAIGLVAAGVHLMRLGSLIGIETVKAGLQLGVIAIVGGGVASALKYLESLREKQRMVNDYRLQVLRDVTASYNEIKGVRRVLRSLGFNSLTAGQFAIDQVTEFHALMKSLNNAQLTLERIKREIKVRTDAFPEELSDLLRDAEDYIRNVLHDWEKYGANIVAGASRKVLEDMTKLKGFLETSEQGFDDGIGSKMKLIQKRISSLALSKE